MAKRRDYAEFIGQEFGDLLVMNWHRSKDHRHVTLLCACKCGVQTFVRASDVLRGHSVRCGYCSGNHKRNIRERANEYFNLFFDKPGINFFGMSTEKQEREVDQS